ncbi:hypothetical protein FOL47_001700 [Perkinsus chesapeaki]|uniref:Uncharacterized protein n=1 Tax=Perkinsus chesapeaki TaxID=330153 RepID=A0A7J6MIU8_PERCH|nr:hypothetical protein FOL47_001700 [Perkinsus chesapeaki]
MLHQIAQGVLHSGKRIPRRRRAGPRVPDGTFTWEGNAPLLGNGSAVVQFDGPAKKLTNLTIWKTDVFLVVLQNTGPTAFTIDNEGRITLNDISVFPAYAQIFIEGTNITYLHNNSLVLAIPDPIDITIILESK